MDFPKSVPSVGLVDGKFIDEDAVAGTPGSLIPSAWGNAVTQEILKVIQEAGLEPDEDDNTQLNAAIDQKITEGAVVFATQPEAEAGESSIKAMSPLRVFQAIAKVVAQATESAFGWLKIATQPQVGAGTDDATAVTPKKLATASQVQVHAAFTTGGTATALTLSPIPAIGAYAPNQRFNVNFSVTGGLNPTLNVSGKGPKAIKQYDSSGAKVAATFVADQISDVIYDGTHFVVLNQLPVTKPVPATESVLGVAYVASQPQTNAGLDDTSFITPKKLRAGFSISLGLNGYIIFPTWMGGIIIQWGQAPSQIAPGGGLTVTLPIAFPNNFYRGVAFYDLAGASELGAASLSVNKNSNSAIRIINTASGGTTPSFIAIGN